MGSLKGFSTRRNQYQLDPATESANEHLDRLIDDFEGVEQVSKCIQQSAKRLVDQLCVMGKLESTVTEGLICSTDVLMHDDRLREIIEDWDSFASINSTLVCEYVVSLNKTLIEPLRLLRRAFDEIKTQIRAHCALQLAVIKLQRKMNAFSDRQMTGKNLVKKQEIRRELIARQTEYTKQTQKLLNELTKFLSGSLEMLTPLLEGFMSSEIVWIQSSKRAIVHQAYSLDSSYLMGERPADRMRTMEDSMRALEALSICRESR